MHKPNPVAPRRSKALAIGGISLATFLLVTNPVVAEAARMITGDDIKNGSISSADIEDGSLRAKDFKNGQLEAGAEGEMGPQGEIGPNGEMGPQGLQGPQGANGNAGARGANGEQGDTGAPGPAGPVDGPAVLMGRMNVDEGNFFSCAMVPVSGIGWSASCNGNGPSTVSTPIPTAKDLRNVWASTAAPVTAAIHVAVYDAETNTEVLFCTIDIGERTCDAAGPIALPAGTNLAVKLSGSVSVSVGYSMELWNPSP